MNTKSVVMLCALAFACAACGQQASTGASADRDQGGITPKSGIEPSPGTKGPGKVDSSGGGAAGDPGSTNRTFEEQKRKTP